MNWKSFAIAAAAAAVGAIVGPMILEYVRTARKA
jgi:hypothetical protein